MVQMRHATPGMIRPDHHGSMPFDLALSIARECRSSRPRQREAKVQTGMFSTQLKAIWIVGMLLMALVEPSPRARAQSVERASPKDISDLEQRGTRYLHNQQPALAVTEYRKILQLDPQNLGAHSNLGLAYYMEANFADAIREFTITLRIKPDLWNITALCGLSEAKDAVRNADALRHLDQGFTHLVEGTEPAHCRWQTAFRYLV